MTDNEMNAVTRCFAAPLGALAVAAAVAFSTAAAAAQTPAPGSDSNVPAAQNQPAARDPAAPSAQPAPPATKPGVGSVDGAPKSSELIGQSVVDKAGQVIGNVSKVDALPSGEIRNVEISTGGFLGFGAKTMRVPADKIERSGQKLVLNLPPEQIKIMMQ